MTQVMRASNCDELLLNVSNCYRVKIQVTSFIVKPHDSDAIGLMISIEIIGDLSNFRQTLGSLIISTAFFDAFQIVCSLKANY